MNPPLSGRIQGVPPNTILPRFNFDSPIISIALSTLSSRIRSTRMPDCILTKRLAISLVLTARALRVFRETSPLRFPLFALFGTRLIFLAGAIPFRLLAFALIRLLGFTILLTFLADLSLVGFSLDLPRLIFFFI